MRAHQRCQGLNSICSYRFWICLNSRGVVGSPCKLVESTGDHCGNFCQGLQRKNTVLIKIDRFSKTSKESKPESTHPSKHIGLAFECLLPLLLYKALPLSSCPFWKQLSPSPHHPACYLPLPKVPSTPEAVAEEKCKVETLAVSVTYSKVSSGLSPSGYWIRMFSGVSYILW